MKKTSSLKSVVIVAVIVAVAFLAYYFYKSGNSTESSSLLSSSSGQPDASQIGSQVLSLLSQIQSLRIDDSLFSDPGYQTLRDYSVVIPAEDVGRDNPFAPIPGFNPASAKTGGSSSQ